MSRRAPRSRSKKSKYLDDGIAREPDAYVVLQPIFDTLWAMSNDSHTRMLTAGPFDTPPLRLELAIFNRMINALKAATQLLEGGHWEFASPIVRHLFETVLNLEHIYSHVDRDAAAHRYVKFGTLQMLRGEIGELEYRAETDRGFDDERLARLRAMTDGYGEFRITDRADGARRWRDSWSGKTTRALAEVSEHNLRKAQYRRLFQGQWSEQTHGAPITYLDGVFRTATASWTADVLARDRVRIAQTAMLLQTIYLELWLMLDSIPDPDPDIALGWSEAVAKTARSLSPEQWDADVRVAADGAPAEE